MRYATLSLVALAGLVVAGCGDPDAEPASTGVTATTPAAASTTEVPVSSAPDTPSTDGTAPAGVAEQAVADLATRLGIDASAITIVRHDEVTWPDSSLGCPKPGFSYTQVLTPGFLIVLEAEGRSYQYHGKARGTPFFCERPTAPVADPTGP